MSARYNLPADTSMQVNDRISKCNNLALILDKYPPYSVIAETKNKGPWLQSLVKGGYIDMALTRSVYNRWHAMMSARNARLFNAPLEWRMVIGLGGETVLETDLTLHHLYGIPFIPGSALKGLTRAYVTGEIDEHKSQDIEKDDAIVKRIFGSQEHAGTVLFFDAMPLNGEVQFVVDIMNPHYPDYYGGNKPPTNDQSPVPVTFLTVTNTTFTFALAPRHPGDPQHESDLKDATKWLQEAIEKYGVGGKTSAGYGYFKMATQGEATLPSKPQERVSQPQSTERIRPNIPKFREGQEITGAVVAPTDELRRKVPDATAFLRYQSFAITDVVIAVLADEAQNWKPGETRICVFTREEERNGFTVLVCQPRVKKKR